MVSPSGAGRRIRLCTNCARLWTPAAGLLAHDPGIRLGDEVLHALRIHGKRLRYTGELAAAAGRGPVRRLVESTVALQDVLGEHQDACVAQHRVRLLLRRRATRRAEELSRIETRQAWLAAWQQVQVRARSLETVA